MNNRFRVEPVFNIVAVISPAPFPFLPVLWSRGYTIHCNTRNRALTVTSEAVMRSQTQGLIPACEIAQSGIPQLWQLMRHRLSSAGKLLMHGNFEANSPTS
jgi:hypothetical protein